MKITVMGAGAVGCYYGGMLARAGHAVTLIGRSLHVNALRRDGLRLSTARWQLNLPVAASTEAAAAHDAELLLFRVKSTDTAAAAAQLALHLPAQATLISLQNGVDNAARLRECLPNEVVPAVVYVAAEMEGPGQVRHHGRGELVLGPTPHADALLALFAGAEVPVHISDNVDGALWAKLIVNCAWNALSALSGLPYGRLLQGEGVEAVMRDVVAECQAVAHASGVTLPGDPWAAVQAIGASMPQQRSSTAQDLARGRRSEIDHLNGHVVRLGAALGIATPANRVLHTLVKLAETSAASR